MDERIKELENRVVGLSKICADLDPYKEISKSMKDELCKHGIVEIADPFAVTNHLLYSMENALEELESLKRESHRPLQ